MLVLGSCMRICFAHECCRGDIETTWTILCNVDLTTMLSVNISYLRAIQVPDYHTVSMTVEEIFSLRISAHDNRLSSFRTRKGGKSIPVGIA